MNRLLALWRTAVGKKIAMAVTGILLVGFLISHMISNCMIFVNPQHLDDYGAFLACKGALGMSLRYLSPPSPGVKWFRFVGRSGAILTGVKPAAIALEAQNCVENARLRKALTFRSPGSAFQMQCSVAKMDDRAEISLARR